jgi:hypothetical protein
MAVELNQVINEVSIIDKTKEGANSAVESMDRVAKGADKMGASTTKSASGFDVLTKAQASAASGLNRLKAEADPAEAAIQRLARAEQMLDRAMRQGLTTEAEKIRVLDQLKLKYNEAALAGGRMGVATSTLSGALSRNAQAIAVLQGPLGAISGRFSALGSLIGAVNPVVAAGAIGFAALSATIGKSVGVAEQFERASLKTQAILKATGSASGQTADGIRKLSHEIAAVTLASTTGVEAAAQKLLTFRSVSGEVFRRTLELSQDLAEIGFGTIESGAVQLGKALQDPEKGLSALTRVGVSFSAQMKEQITLLNEQGRVLEAQTLILNAVEEQVGGAGRAAAGGLSGAYDTLSQRIEDFLLNVGNTGPLSAATSAINALAGSIGRLNKSLFPDTQTEIEKIAERLSGMNPNAGAMAPGGMGTGIINIQRQREELQSRLADLLEMQRLDRTLEERARQSASRIQAEGAAANDNERAKSVEEYIKALNTEIEVLRLSDVERGKRNAADKAEKEARKDIADITDEEVKSVREAAISAEVEAQAIKKATDARKADEQATKALSERRSETVDGLKSEQEYLKRLLDAQRLGKDEVWEVEAARKAELVAIQLKIDSGTEERATIEDIVIANESLRKSIKQVADEQATAEKAAKDAAKAQKKAAEDAQKEYDKLIDSIANISQEKLGDALYGHLKGETIDFAAFMKDTLLRAIADIVAAAATQQFVIPIATSVVGALPGLFGLSGQAAGVAQSAAGGITSNPLSSLSSIFSIASGGPTSLANSFSFSSIGQALGLSTAAAPLTAFSAPLGGVAGGVTTAAMAGSPSLLGGAVAPGLTSAGAGLAAAAGPLAIAAMAAMLIGPMLFGGNPSVGPVGIADFAPGLGRGREFDQPLIDPFTADNGGNGEAMRPIAEAIADLIADSADRFAATIDGSLRFRVANYASPESGSGRMGGFEVNAFIRGEAENRIAEGLSQEQAIFEALRFAVTEAFTFDSATMAEIAANTSATTTEELLADLEFGRNFDMLNEALSDLGNVVNANTLAAAQLQVAIQNQAEQFATDNATPIVDSLRKAIELFPGMITETITRTVTDASAAASDLAGTVDGLRPGESRLVDPFGNEFAGTLPFGSDADRDADGRVILPGTIEGLGPDGLPVFPTGTEGGDVYIRALEDVATVTEEISRQSANYAANLERVGLAVDMAKAGMDLLVDQITGDFEPAVRGPFQQALEQGQANLDALRTHFEDVNAQIEAANDAFPELNESLIDVTQTIADAQTALIANLQDDFNDSIQRQINDATGLSSLNMIDDLITQRGVNAADAVALGLSDNDTAGTLFDAQLRNMLSGATSADLTRLLASSNVTDAQTREVIEALLDSQAVEEFTAALDSSVQALESQTDAIKGQIDDWRSIGQALQQGRLARALNPEISILDPQARMETALAEFERVRSLALGGDQDAIGQFDSAGDAALQAFVEYFGQTNQNTVDLFNRIQGDSRAIEDMGVTQIDLLQSQLDALEGIRATLEAQGGSGSQNFGANPVRNRILASLTGYGGDFGAGGFGQFLASSGLPQSILDQVNNIAGTINFANGGIMTGRGSLPLNMYSAGGVANSPQLAMYGEGRMPEAYVPLPDGRSIPVTVKVAGAANDDMREMAGALREIAGLLRTQIQISGIGAEGTVKGLAKVEEKLDGVEKRLRGAAA